MKKTMEKEKRKNHHLKTTDENRFVRMATVRGGRFRVRNPHTHDRVSLCREARQGRENVDRGSERKQRGRDLRNLAKPAVKIGKKGDGDGGPKLFTRRASRSIGRD